MPDHLLSNADITLSLLRSGYTHACDRCGRGMHVRYASGLCVWCYNEQVRGSRDGHRAAAPGRRVAAAVPARATGHAPAPAAAPSPKPSLAPAH